MKPIRKKQGISNSCDAPRCRHIVALSKGNKKTELKCGAKSGILPHRFHMLPCESVCPSTCIIKSLCSYAVTRFVRKSNIRGVGHDTLIDM